MAFIPVHSETNLYNILGNGTQNNCRPYVTYPYVSTEEYSRARCFYFLLFFLFETHYLRIPRFSLIWLILFAFLFRVSE
ncbi:hypothetical protein N7527_002416 [Penicillium freii]|nr:hypothetical protein N7527_002416 [Penicillium freii]